MEPGTWILLFVVLVVALVAGRSIFTHKARTAVEVDPLYVQALEAIANGVEGEAIHFLKSSIESNPSSFAPYLLLGDLLRKKHDVERALKIHRELSVRPNLENERKVTVLKSLVRDQIALGLFSEAIEGCQKMIGIEKKDRTALELLLIAYEGKKLWDDAIDVAKKYSRMFMADSKSFMAHYMSFVAKEELKEDMEAAKKKLKRALSYDPSCQPAQIYLGDILYEEKDYDRAIEVWSKFLNNTPEAIKDLSARLEKAYFEGGHFGRMTEVYESLSHDLPGNPDVLIGLSRMYHRKGEVSAALRLAAEAREIDTDNPEVYRTLIELYAEMKEYEPLLAILNEYFDERVSESSRKECRYCGLSAEEFFWRCPQCRSWQINFEEKVD
jgi:lipopolysaccharide biosynthesis regulator YciM